MMHFLGKVFLRGEIEVLTGMHIGGIRDSMEIGGMDNPVVKTLNGVPYIPASSMKGKIRCLLERKYGVKKAKEGQPCGCGDCIICRLFGSHSAESKTLTRLYIRDAFLNEDHYRAHFRFPFEEDFTYTEEKAENIIDRLKEVAQHPRLMERVPAGARFSLEMMVNFYEQDEIAPLVMHLMEGLRLLEDDHLGGSGSRGYGKIAFRELRLVAKSKRDYQKENTEYPLAEGASLVDVALEPLCEKVVRFFKEVEES
ncbi:MAG: type III-A CRISPR-associated RAMP protein Csm3 [Candidatus Caldatribacteriaceae bacterium]